MKDTIAVFILGFALSLLGAMSGACIGYMVFVIGGPDYSTDNAWCICSSWSGKCAIYPFNEWKHEGDTFYHRKDPTKFLRVNKWVYRVTKVRVGADGQLVE